MRGVGEARRRPPLCEHACPCVALVLFAAVGGGCYDGAADAAVHAARRGCRGACVWGGGGLHLPLPLHSFPCPSHCCRLPHMHTLTRTHVCAHHPAPPRPAPSRPAAAARLHLTAQHQPHGARAALRAAHPRPGQPAARHRPGRPQGHGHRQILHQSGEPLARAAALAGATLASGLYVWGGGSPPDGSAACPLSSVAPFPGCAQVPTDYYSLWGRRTHTYQYSVTEYYHRFTGNEEAPPAVYLL